MMGSAAPSAPSRPERQAPATPEKGLYVSFALELEIWAENQRGEKVVTGRASVGLPSRL